MCVYFLLCFGGGKLMGLVWLESGIIIRFLNLGILKKLKGILEILDLELLKSWIFGNTSLSDS